MGVAIERERECEWVRLAWPVKGMGAASGESTVVTVEGEAVVDRDEGLVLGMETEGVASVRVVTGAGILEAEGMRDCRRWEEASVVGRLGLDRIVAERSSTSTW